MTVPVAGSRPFTVIGTGTLGRRIAVMWLTRGREVRLYDTSQSALQSAKSYIEETLATLIEQKVSGGSPGTLKVGSDLDSAIKNSWIITECVPEKLELKVDVLGQISSKMEPDTILATTSSYFEGKELFGKVSEERRSQLVTTHYFSPPETLALEIMADESSDPAIPAFIKAEAAYHGFHPYEVKKDSIGLIADRVWAAIKRECVAIIETGVAESAEIDRLLQEVLHIEPCRRMDEDGIQNVRDIERRYQAAFPSIKTQYSENINYLDKMLGERRLGSQVDKGFYDYEPLQTQERIIYLDILNGYVRSRSVDGREDAVIAADLVHPDGVQIASDGSIFVTCMGIPDQNDGYLVRLAQDANGSSWTKEVIVKPGDTFTAKQTQIDHRAGRIYWCDREGGRIQRCNLDGSSLETLYRTAENAPRPLAAESEHCVGIALDTARGYLYWTQKGSPRGGEGRIFRMNIELPAGADVHARPDVETLWDGLPEPIDLALNSDGTKLYWTDRGDNTLNVSALPASLDPARSPKSAKDRTILAGHFHQTIGLELDEPAGYIYVADIQGGLYRLTIDGRKKTKLVDIESGGFTGVSLMKAKK